MHAHPPLSPDARNAAAEPAAATVSRFERHWIRGTVWTGVLAAMLVTMPTSLAEIAIIPPALFFLPLCWKHPRVWTEIVRRPAFLLLLALMSWLTLGLAWSTNRGLGIEEVGNFRFFVVAILLAPAIRTTTTGRGRLIAAMCLGFLIGHAVQALNAWALLADGPAMFRFGRLANRLSGWWDPAVAGTILTAALGLHLPVALMGSGKARRIATACVSVTLVGLLVTGSRGGWIASAMLIVLVSLIALVRAVRSKSGRRRTLITLGVLAAVLAGTGTALRSPIAQRVEQARNEVSAAFRGDIVGDTGVRIALKQESISAFASHPLIGVGTGALSDRIARERGPGDRVAAFDHAHDTLLHLAASNGIVAVVLALLCFAACARDGLRWCRTFGIGTYHAGPVFALIGLGLATPFDTLHVSASAAAVTGMIFALCLAPPASTAHRPIDIAAADRLRNARPETS